MKTTEPIRCPWSRIADREYARYHDEEWGVPLSDDRALFEKIVLEGFQSGLSWLTILKKRESFRRAFDGFEATRMARYDKSDIARLMGDAGIVRNRLKIEAAIANARALLRLSAHTSLAAFLWGYLDGRPLINRHRSARTVPAATAMSAAISQGLKAHGFRFVGPTTIYAFMQSAGMVNDHIVSCHRHAPCAALQRAFELPRNLGGTSGGELGDRLRGKVAEGLAGKPAVARSGNAARKLPGGRGAR
jgi:DNA-3-methyladenine glycosylase I